MKDNETFRFGSKIEYELEMGKMLSRLNKLRVSRRKSINERKMEEEYEDLMEEYMRFCSNGEELDGEK